MLCAHLNVMQPIINVVQSIDNVLLALLNAVQPIVNAMQSINNVVHSIFSVCDNIANSAQLELSLARTMILLSTVFTWNPCPILPG